jgi:pentatricopeptide repeat protein
MAFRPTIATYTVLIRGLFRRKKFKDAEKYWRKLLQTGLVIDKQALTVGLQTLTRVGKPYEAFAVLERMAARVDVKYPATYKLQRPVILTAISMNEFLVALNRIARPDIVFKLWDHMEELYGVLPDANTLSILLQSTRLAVKMDNTLSGAVAHFSLKNPFRKSPARPSSRKEIISSIAVLLGEPGKGLRPYVSGIWNDQTPLEKARTVFQQVMFGESPEQLSKVQSPAHAIRSSIDTDSFRPMAELTQGLGLPNLNTIDTQFIPPPDLLTPEGRSRYPQIVPTNRNCFNYIILLGISSRAAEIPLTLAWMRALGISPSRSTLSVALVFWAEVSMQAPLIEKWSGGASKSEYTRLVEWIVDWVGEQRLPEDAHFMKWLHIIEKIRNT